LATNFYDLGLVYQAQDRYKNAEPLLRRSLATSEKNGADHSNIITALDNLAVLYENLDKSKKAAELRRCLPRRGGGGGLKT